MSKTRAGKAYAILSFSAMAVFILDQLTKWLARLYIAPDESIVVIPGLFDLVNIRNRGAAFGFLNRPDIEWQFWLFLGATILAAGVIIFLARGAKKQPVFVCGLGLILGGAIGNLVDRIRYRAVVDFLDFYWRDLHWPAFNVADMGICIGAFLACVAAWRNPGAAR